MASSSNVTSNARPCIFDSAPIFSLIRARSAATSSLTSTHPGGSAMATALGLSPHTPPHPPSGVIGAPPQADACTPSTVCVVVLS